MSLNYARHQPIDKNGNVYPTIPARPANARFVGVPTSSSVIGLDVNTTVLDVTVVGGQSANAIILGKWGNTAVTTSNYDWVVNSGQTRTFVVPQSVIGTASVQGANAMNGLYASFAMICGTAQSASVFTAEF